MNAVILMLIDTKKLEIKLDKLEKEAISKFLNEATLMIETSAKRLCPVETGELRGSISSYVEGDTGVVGTNKEYAVYVHQGTGIYAVNGDGRDFDLPWRYQDANGHSTKGQKPQPFLTQSLEENKGNLEKLLKNKIEEAVK